MSLEGRPDTHQQSSEDIRRRGDDIDHHWRKGVSGHQSQWWPGSAASLHVRAPAREDHRLSFDSHHNDHSHISHGISHTRDSLGCRRLWTMDMIHKTNRPARSARTLARSHWLMENGFGYQSVDVADCICCWICGEMRGPNQASAEPQTVGRALVGVC